MKMFLTLLFSSLVHLVVAQTTVSGVITDADTGEPVPGAEVEISTLHLGTVTDSDGKFLVSRVPFGIYSLMITHISYESREVRIDVSQNALNQSIELTPSTMIAEEVIVNSTRAGENTPVTYSELGKSEIESKNNGQDLPYILNFTPSIVTTSDAGAGIGYTGMRIRGSDATRINVTINGVPLNDGESQGVFWVDIPDIASSTNTIQIQRGVGTSTNGAGAFGGTINLLTLKKNEAPYVELTGTGGSYNTYRGTVGFGTGLIKNHWTLDGRISTISSDGYIDRATSDLDSYYFSAGYYNDKTLIKAIAFGGAERTYQSWYGTPEAVLNNDSEGIEDVIINNGLDDEQAENIRTSGRTFNWYLYDDQVDDYKQHHYQLQLSQWLAPQWTASVALHYTKGQGYYEEYKRDQDLADYGTEDIIAGNTTISSTDLVRRRWLDNDFYGITYSLNYTPSDKAGIILGGAANRYDGDHFGEVIWAEWANTLPKDYRYYFNNGDKKDFNLYAKATIEFDRLTLFGDLQYRGINYQVDGIDNDLRSLELDQNYNFFNPKLGAGYALTDNGRLYASLAVANREPVRTDFLDSPTLPKSERLYNLEAGYRNIGNIPFQANIYVMDYTDQLVLTGELNDVGSSLRKNVPDSYRAGIELQAAFPVSKNLKWQVNSTFSRNKIKNFTEVIYDYGENFDEYNEIQNEYSNTDISFSPSVIAGSQIIWVAARKLMASNDKLEFALLTKYVGKQYLDNTSNGERKIDPYFTNDIRMRYTLAAGSQQLSLTLLVNNILAEEYSSNGYTFGYRAGDNYEVRENYYYPQAPTNFLVTLGLKI